MRGCDERNQTCELCGHRQGGLSALLSGRDESHLVKLISLHDQETVASMEMVSGALILTALLGVPVALICVTWASKLLAGGQ